VIYLGQFPQGIGLENAFRSELGRVNRDFGRSQVESIKGAFNDGGHHRRGGERWALLSPETVERKRSNRPLVLTGELKNSVRFTLRENTIEIFTDNPVARFHQFGTRNIPNRPIMTATERDISNFMRQIKVRVERAINGV
jgi:phage gpG-like protein